MPLIGVYSFPKSGNTWIRAIVADAISGQSGTVNRLHGVTNEIPEVPDLHQQPLSSAVEYRGYRFFKLHARQHLREWAGTRLDVERVIHIRRNPLDVFMSYMNYMSRNVTGIAPIPFNSVDEIRKTSLFDMYFHNFIVSGHLSSRFAHFTGTYFENNRYWLNQTDVPAVLLTYEELLANPQRSMRFLKPLLNLTDIDLERSITRANSATGRDGRFFWKKREKTYFDYLSFQQIEEFIRYRGQDCLEIGYSPDYLMTPPQRF